MFLRIFKSNQPIVILLLPFVLLAIWLPGFFLNYLQLFVFDHHTGVFYGIFSNLSVNNIVFTKLIALVIILFIGFSLVRLNTKFFFISRRTQLPAFLYLLIVSSFVPLQRFNSVLISVIILIYIIERVFDSYKYNGIAYHYFDSALMVSISSLFYINSIYFITFLWIGLILFRSYKWREWVFTIIGLGLPYLMIIFYYYFFDKDITLFHQRLREGFINDSFFIKHNLYFKLFAAFVCFLLIITSGYMIRHYNTKKVQSRKIFSFFLLIFIISILFYFLIPSFGMEILFIIAIPLSFLFSHYFMLAKLNWINNVLFSLLVTGVFFICYYDKLLHFINLF